MPVLEPLNTELNTAGTSREPDDANTVLQETLGSEDSRLRSVVRDGHVSELAVVGRARGADSVPRLQRVGVEVIASGLRDSIREVPGMSQSKVVRVVGETDTVLIQQVSEGNRVSTRGGGEDQLGQRGVVRLLMTVSARELSLQSNVLGLVGEADNSVGHADIERQSEK